MMKSAALLALASVGASAKELDLSAPVNDHELINTINADPSKTWKAAPSKRFEGMTLEQAKRLMGAKKGSAQAKAKHSQWDLVESTALPSEFDTRTAFPWATNVTSVIRDQSSCGSCWAVSSTDSITDRMAIAKNSTVILSAGDTLACCTGFACFGSSGCDGGQPDEAWAWFASTGVVTGGSYEAQTGCEPYPFPMCAHHVTEPNVPPCPTNEYPTPSCSSSCTNNNYAVPYAQDKKLATSSYNLNSVQAAMTDLVARGPFTVAFQVFQDFLTYSGGVYTCPTSGQSLGGHAVSVIGYGTENGVDYWLVKNSWNSGWGVGA